MTATCRVCHAEIAQRFVGATVVWGHLVNPRDEHHYAAPLRETQREASDRSGSPRASSPVPRSAPLTQPG